MARLTEGGKQKFLDLIVASTFSERKESLAQKWQALAVAVYMSQGAERITLLESLPEGVVPKSVEVKCYFGGQRYDLYLDEQLPLGYSVHNNRFRFGVDDALTQRFEELNRADSTITKEERELRSQIRSLLAAQHPQHPHHRQAASRHMAGGGSLSAERFSGESPCPARREPEQADRRYAKRALKSFVKILDLPFYVGLLS